MANAAQHADRFARMTATSLASSANRRASEYARTAARRLSIPASVNTGAVWLRLLPRSSCTAFSWTCVYSRSSVLPRALCSFATLSSLRSRTARAESVTRRPSITRREKQASKPLSISERSARDNDVVVLARRINCAGTYCERQCGDSSRSAMAAAVGASTKAHQHAGSLHDCPQGFVTTHLVVRRC